MADQTPEIAQRALDMLHDRPPGSSPANPHPNWDAFELSMPNTTRAGSVVAHFSYNRKSGQLSRVDVRWDDVMGESHSSALVDPSSSDTSDAGR